MPGRRQQDRDDPCDAKDCFFMSLCGNFSVRYPHLVKEAGSTATKSWIALTRKLFANVARKRLRQLASRLSANSDPATAGPNSYLMIFRKPPNLIGEWIPHKWLL